MIKAGAAGWKASLNELGRASFKTGKIDPDDQETQGVLEKIDESRKISFDVLEKIVSAKDNPP